MNANHYYKVWKINHNTAQDIEQMYISGFLSLILKETNGMQL